MPVIESRLDPRDPVFAKHRQAMSELVADLRSKVAEVEAGGGEVASAKHTARGKLLPRERVRALVDPGGPFLELSPLAAYGMYDGTIASAGIVTGVGRVASRECVIVCNDATVKGGTYFPKIFIRYQSWAEYPYSPGFIPIMAHVNLHIGAKFFIITNSSQHD